MRSGWWRRNMAARRRGGRVSAGYHPAKYCSIPGPDDAIGAARPAIAGAERPRFRSGSRPDSVCRSLRRPPAGGTGACPASKPITPFRRVSVSLSTGAAEERLATVARLFSRRQCNRLHGLVVPSRAMREVLERYGVRTTMRVIPTGMPLDAFQEGDRGLSRSARHRGRSADPGIRGPGGVREEYRIPAGGGPGAQADQPSRYRVDRRREGPAEGRLHRLAGELGVRTTCGSWVIWRGDRSGELLSGRRAFVFASRTETQGLVLLEAMSLGVPVVSTAVAEVPATSWRRARARWWRRRSQRFRRSGAPRAGRCRVASAAEPGGAGIRPALDGGRAGQALLAFYEQIRAGRDTV